MIATFAVCAGAVSRHEGRDRGEFYRIDFDKPRTNPQPRRKRGVRRRRRDGAPRPPPPAVADVSPWHGGRAPLRARTPRPRCSRWRTGGGSFARGGCGGVGGASSNSMLPCLPGQLLKAVEEREEAERMRQAGPPFSLATRPLPPLPCPPTSLTPTFPCPPSVLPACPPLPLCPSSPLPQLPCLRLPLARFAPPRPLSAFGWPGPARAAAPRAGGPGVGPARRGARGRAAAPRGGGEAG